MPFTASHIAAIVPLARKPMSVSALVIGSMIPDAPYFVPTGVGAQFTHSLLGAMSADAALGLMAFVVWHAVLGLPCTDALPDVVRAHVLAETTVGLRQRVRELRQWVLIYLSLITGALTHLLWDAFTHDGRWGSERVPWLGQQHGPLQGYRYAQYASGVIGAVVIFWWLIRWAATRGLAVSDLRPGTGARLSLLAIVGIGAVCAAQAASGPMFAVGSVDWRRIAYLVATRGISGAAACALALAVAWHLRRRPLRARL